MVGGLELEKLVVAAALAVGIVAADTRPSVVDGAAARRRVEETADSVKDPVLLMAQESRALGKARLCLLLGEAEMLRQPGDVLLRDFDLRVAAAVPRTFAA